MKISKESIESKLKEFNDLFSNKVKKLDKFYEGFKYKVDVLIGATQTMIEDVCASDKDYVRALKEKKDADGQVFSKIENFVTSVQESLLKFDFTSKASISQDQMSSIVSSVESCFKTELSHILTLVLCLPNNAPRPVANVSQWGEWGFGLSKNSGEDKGKIVGKLISTQIPTSLPMKAIMTACTMSACCNFFDYNTSIPNVERYLSKLQ